MKKKNHSFLFPVLSLSQRDPSTQGTVSSYILWQQGILRKVQKITSQEVKPLEVRCRHSISLWKSMRGFFGLFGVLIFFCSRKLQNWWENSGPSGIQEVCFAGALVQGAWPNRRAYVQCTQSTRQGVKWQRAHSGPPVLPVIPKWYQWWFFWQPQQLTEHVLCIA